MFWSIADGSHIDPKFEQLLNSLPPKRARSRLEPYRELIREMRKRQCSYREIVQILHDHFGLRVAASTVNNFVISRLNTKISSKGNRRSLSGMDRTQKERAESFRQPKAVQESLRCAEDVMQPTGSKSERPFHYDDNERFASYVKPTKPPTISPNE